MEHSFSVTVSKISRKEFNSALRGMFRRREIVFLLIAFLAFLVLVLAKEDPSLLFCFSPLIAPAVVAALFEFIFFNTYNQFPGNLTMDYTMDAEGWKLLVNGDNGSSAWADMYALVERKHVFLLCHTKTSSNLLPKRCLTAEQIEQIRTWYNNAK